MDYERGGTQKEIYSESEVEYVSCPLCFTNHYKEIHKERGVLGVVLCSSCNLLYINPRLKAPEKIYWGDADKYFREASLIFEERAKHHRDPNYIEDLKRIYKFKPTGNLLDIGTNMGFFLRKARGRKWNLYGVDPSPSLSKLARDYFGLNVKTAFLEDANFSSDFFDVVTMTDVFEHIPDPKKMLTEIMRIMKPEGVLYIKVPNANFNLFKLLLNIRLRILKNDDIFDAYEHVVHYTKKTLSTLLETSGFTPLKFYVGKPIQLPAWHKYVGHFYQYPSPWYLDAKKYLGRKFFYWIGKLEYLILDHRIGYFAPNIVTIAKKKN